MIETPSRRWSSSAKSGGFGCGRSGALETPGRGSRTRRRASGLQALLLRCRIRFSPPSSDVGRQRRSSGTPAFRVGWHALRNEGRGKAGRPRPSLGPRDVPPVPHECGHYKPFFNRQLAASQVSQHFVQDAAVAVVVDFDRGVDAAGGGEAGFAAVGLCGGDLDRLARL